MASIRLLFSTSHHPISAAIRACTWSKWSHVALLDGPFAIEAVARAAREGNIDTEVEELKAALDRFLI